MCSVDSHSIPKLLTLVIFIAFFCGVSNGLVLRAYISQHGLHGEVEFTHKNGSLISIRTNLQPTLQFPDQVWKWSIHEFPVDYRDLDSSRCNDANVGYEVYDLTKELGYLVIPGKDHAEFESEVPLTGKNGVWGKSLVLETVERDRIICASIFSLDKVQEKHAVAKFSSPIAGTINFRWVSTIDEADSYIETDLYHTKSMIAKKDPLTQHNWKLFVTDYFDSDKAGNHEDNCNVLQMVFDPANNGDGMSVGDLDKHLGKVKVATDSHLHKVKTLYKDEVINAIGEDLETTKRSLYVVVFDDLHPESFLACAKVRLMEGKKAKALISSQGISGVVEFTQRSPFEPTWATFQLGAVDRDYEANLRFVGSVLAYQIRELPAKVTDVDDLAALCNTTGDIYNPTQVDLKGVPPAGMGTQDQYAAGDLLGKHLGRTAYLNHRYLLPGLAPELNGAYWDVFLPLQGAYSILFRSLLVLRKDEHPSLCGSLIPYIPGTEHQVQMTSAEAVFRYPVVGKVIFRQPQDRPWEDTTIIIESMIHADGASVNTTREHRWALHEHAPGRDYYNWTARCLSAGKVYEPFGLDVDTRHPEQYCQIHLEGLCRLGDLTTRHGMLTVAGRKRDSDALTRRMFTDTVIAVAGKTSIMRKSLVIYDDHGPVARGERMACSIVGGLHRRKAVVRDWFGNGAPVSLRGKLELTQQSPYDLTNGEVRFDGVSQLADYKIHVAPVERELEFPCEKESLLDTYDPYNVDSRLSPKPGHGTPDQYPLGELSAKYGALGGASYRAVLNDSLLPLFGPHSVLGRSVVLHIKAADRRSRHYACASIERGYSPSEARELRAIASFHHPAGFAYGFVRMTQLVHNDGSTSDTILEVKLRYPGAQDRNLTHHHKWAVFVNPVGVDAAVRVAATRCVAAGYRWNPYFTQLADPLNQDLYNQECGADNPLRCDVGDLSSRLGTISVGGPRQVFADSNFPLEGVVSAMGRSLVVFGPENSADRFACANIEPDNDIIKYVNIMKPPRFVLGQFLGEVRRVLGAPPWLLGVDARRSRALHGGACLQLLLHFAGPRAARLEQDFTRLISSGRLDAPSISIPGYVDTKRKKSLSYRPCGVTDPNEKRGSRKSTSLFSYSTSAPRFRPSTLLLYSTTFLLAVSSLYR